MRESCEQAETVQLGHRYIAKNKIRWQRKRLFERIDSIIDGCFHSVVAARQSLKISTQIGVVRDQNAIRVLRLGHAPSACSGQ